MLTCSKFGVIGNAHSARGAQSLRRNLCRAELTVAIDAPCEGNHLPTFEWFVGFGLVTTSCNITLPTTIAEHLGIGQKVAWVLGQGIRRMIEEKDGLLAGIVEADGMALGRRTRSKEWVNECDPNDG